MYELLCMRICFINCHNSDFDDILFCDLGDNVDFNNLTQNGFYTGKFSEHTPDDTTVGYWNVEVSLFDNNINYVYQKACKTNSNAYYSRYFDNTGWSEWERYATISDMKDRSNIWSGSLELSSENQTINIASAENYNQILVIIRNAENNITVAIMIDRYFYNSVTNIYYRVSDSSYHANIDIVPILASFEVRLEGEYTGAWTLVAVIGKI